MTGVTAEITALLLLAGVLAFAMVQPRGLPEATVALPAAGIILALGILTPTGALDQLRQLGPTVGFLATVLVLAHLANSASTLLPISNTTNLLAFPASGLSFLGFTALMAAPWLVSLANGRDHVALLAAHTPATPRDGR